MNKFSCVPNNEMINFWIKNNLNVLIFGRHGVGKTSIMLDGFKRNNVKFLQFSAATMDPWVDFVGVPQKSEDEKGSYLELIRPKAFRDDEVEALFFDELNRSHKKVRNAVMELIQFKSINGKSFPKLRMIWAAVNPDDDNDLKYDVEKLDGAQEDRFQVHIEIPYKPYAPYFREKYGKEATQSLINWWHDLPEGLKLQVSPRRLEYALQMYKAGGRLEHVLPPASNVSKLEYSLINGWPLETYRKLRAAGNEEKLRSWLGDENNYSAVKDSIISKPEDALHLLPEEKICSLAAISSKVEEYILSNHDKFLSTIKMLANSSANITLKKKAIATINGLNSIRNPPGLGSKGSAFVVDRNYSGIDVQTPIAIINAAKNMNAFDWSNDSKITFDMEKRTHYGLDQNLATITQSIAKCGSEPKERLRICNSIIRLIKNVRIMSESELKISLKVIDWVASKTQVQSLFAKTENLVPAVNKCVVGIRQSNPSFSVKDFISAYPNIAGKLISRTHLSEKWFISPRNTVAQLVTTP